MKYAIENAPPPWCKWFVYDIKSFRCLNTTVRSFPIHSLIWMPNYNGHVGFEWGSSHARTAMSQHFKQNICLLRAKA